MMHVRIAGLVWMMALAVGLLAGCDGSKQTGRSDANQGAIGDGDRPGPRNETALDLGNKISMKLLLIPAGRFSMGSDPGEKERSKDEGPVHEVTISRPFYLGAWAVTQEQYEQVMGNNPSYFKGAQNPVDQASWGDAVEFCKKVSQKTGRTVRLPTEAEREYACRAGGRTRFCYGDDSEDRRLPDFAWFKNNSDSKTHPVGQKRPNEWGLYDVHGNVWEWCSDWYGPYDDKAQTDPAGPGASTYRVLRGGCWKAESRYCRSAYRSWEDPNTRIPYFGFRVAMDAK